MRLAVAIAKLQARRYSSTRARFATAIGFDVDAHRWRTDLKRSSLTVPNVATGAHCRYGYDAFESYH